MKNRRTCACRERSRGYKGAIDRWVGRCDRSDQSEEESIENDSPHRQRNRVRKSSKRQEKLIIRYDSPAQEYPYCHIGIGRDDFVKQRFVVLVIAHCLYRIL